mgnify:FL=1|jgi:hypothetical protein
MSSSYRNLLLRQIEALEEKILLAKSDRKELQKILNDLKKSEFEEDMREENDQQLLKG